MTGQNEPVGFLESCRLCLRNKGMYNIFNDRGLMQDIEEFTGVTMLLSNNLPQLICGECWGILKSMKELRIVATRNDLSMKYLVTGTLQVEEYEQNKQVGYEKNASSVNSSTDMSCNEHIETYVIKIEDVTDVEPWFDVDNHVSIDPGDRFTSSPCSDTNEINGTQQITVRNDLFFKPEIEPCPDTQKHIKPEQKELPKSRKPKLEKDNNDFRCPICEKQFVTWRKMYYHVRLHNKSFSCTLDGCKKKFSSKSDLEKHFRTHTGVKPYQCDLCSRRFTQNGSLKSHKETVHKVIVSPNKSQKCPNIVTTVT